MSKTMVLPSGDTSREIQVPLVVVKVCVRAVLRGSVLAACAAPALGGAACAWSASGALKSSVAMVRQAIATRGRRSIEATSVGWLELGERNLVCGEDVGLGGSRAPAAEPSG